MRITGGSATLNGGGFDANTHTGGEQMVRCRFLGLPLTYPTDGSGDEAYPPLVSPAHQISGIRQVARIDLPVQLQQALPSIVI